MPNPGNLGGGNSPNGGATPLAKPGSNGMGDSQRNYLINAYPLGSPSTPSTKQEIIAEYASGLGFYPDALSLGTPKELIQVMYPIKPPSVTVAAIVGLIKFGDLEIEVQSSARFNFKKIEQIHLNAGVPETIDGITARFLAIQSTLPVSVALNGVNSTPPASSFLYCNFAIGATSIILTASESTDVKIYIFT